MAGRPGTRNEVESPLEPFATSPFRDLEALDQLPSSLRVAIAYAPVQVACEPILDVWSDLVRAGASASDLQDYIDHKILQIEDLWHELLVQSPASMRY